MAEISLRPLALLLLLALNVALATAGSVNFACGRSDSFTDSDGTSWTGDGIIATLGVAAEVNDTAGVPEPLTHLRWFITGTCYDINQITIGSSVTVTTRFYYGNFDGKDSPPQFLVQYDNNQAVTIILGTDAFNYSLTYKALSDTVSICFAVPIGDFTNTAFVNAIQVEGSGVNTASNTAVSSSVVNTAISSSGKKKTRKAIIAVPVVIVVFLVLAGVTVFLLVSRQRRMAQLAIQQGAYPGAGGPGAMGQTPAAPYGQGFDGVQQNPQGVKPYAAGP